MKIFLSSILFVSLLTAQHDSIYLAEHLLPGNPSNAETLKSDAANYLVVKKQFVLSYHRFNGISNWVAWHLDSLCLGSIRRSDDFRPDTSLPDKWYRVHEKSYRRSGYDRGHMCPSGDRTNTQQDNSATFIMTNIIPQAPNNNQGPWASLESYCRDLVRQGKELYIYCGGYGSRGFIDSGRVNVPERTWKVIIVLDAGDDDISRISSSTRTIAVDMPNDNEALRKHDDWKIFRTTIDHIESKTTLDFLSRLPEPVETVLESVVDVH